MFSRPRSTNVAYFECWISFDFCGFFCCHLDFCFDLFLQVAQVYPVTAPSRRLAFWAGLRIEFGLLLFFSSSSDPQDGPELFWDFSAAWRILEKFLNVRQLLQVPAHADSFIFSDFTDLFLRRPVSFSGDSSAKSSLLRSFKTYKKSSTKRLSEVSEIKILAGCYKSAGNFRQLSVLGVHDFSPHFDRFFFACFWRNYVQITSLDKSGAFGADWNSG